MIYIAIYRENHVKRGMSFKELITIFLIVLADMATTHMLMLITDTCCVERNPFLRSLCNEIGYGATWLWIPVEFSVIALVYEALKKLRVRFRALIEVEKIFLVLATVPVINNIVNLLMIAP
jgi:hypothetical protein